MKGDVLMKRIYESPLIDISEFDIENIVTTSPAAPTNTSLYGMQDFTTIQKVTHVLENGSPRVEEILQYHVH